MRVVHLSLFHAPLDTRIFSKECITLADAGYDVHLVTGGPKTASRDGVSFHALGTLPADVGLWRRLWLNLRGAWKALSVARGLRAPLYHLHEVPLIPVGLWLRFRGARVIYDVHEDALREKISHGRTLGHPWAGWVFGLLAVMLEAAAQCFFQGFVAATPHIGSKFPARRTVVVQNFPRLEDCAATGDAAAEPAYDQREPRVAYIGNIFVNRGAREMVEAFSLLPQHLDARLVIAGRFVPAGLQQELEELPGWQYVEFLGWQEAEGVQQILAQARVGLVVLHPRPEYLTAYPVKMFEYMGAGLPVVASDFPLWRQIIEEAGCGTTVDPHQPQAIADAIQHLLENPERAALMGQQGHLAVCEKYNWQQETAKLLDLYHRLTES